MKEIKERGKAWKALALAVCLQLTMSTALVPVVYADEDVSYDDYDKDSAGGYKFSTDEQMKQSMDSMEDVKEFHQENLNNLKRQLDYYKKWNGTEQCGGTDDMDCSVLDYNEEIRETSKDIADREKWISEINKGLEYYSEFQPTYQKIRDAYETAQAVDEATDVAEGVSAVSDGAWSLRDFSASDALSAYGDITNLSEGSTGDKIGSVGDLYSNFGGSAAEAEALGVIGSAIGRNISESISYRSVGSNGKYECWSSTPYPTINESVSVKCAGIPMGRAQWVISPYLEFHDTPTSGGRHRFRGGGTAWGWSHHGPRPVGSIYVDIEYNVYEGDVTMGGDIFSSETDRYDFFGDLESSSSAFDDAGFSGLGEGSLTDAVTLYERYGEQGVIGDGSNYIPDNMWENPSSSTPYGRDGWTEGEIANMRDYYSNDGSSYNASGADWASSVGGGGSWGDSGNPWSGEGSSWDGSGFSWNGGGTTGYSPFGNDDRPPTAGMEDLDGYFGNNGNDGFDANNSGAAGMTEDDTGLSNLMKGATARSVLGDGGYVGKDGQVYDAGGNSWGSADGAGLLAIDEGSEQMNNIFADGGWTEGEYSEDGTYYETIFDGDGNVAGYVTPEGFSEGKAENIYEGNESFGDSALDMLNGLMEMLGSTGYGNGYAELFGGNTGSAEDGTESSSLLGSFLSLFGESAGVTPDSVRKETMSSQEMYGIASDILRKMGYSDEDIAAGLNYDKDSAYTEPDIAWDMNRISTLQKTFKIKAEGNKKPHTSAIMKAAGKYNVLNKH